MPSAENAKLEYESGQDSVAMSALTDSGDAKIFNSSKSIWSGKSGFSPVVRPNGLATGGAASVAISGTNNLVDVAALTCYLAGVLTSVSAVVDKVITRGATNVAKISSVTINSSGAVTIIAGADSTDPSFSEVRGAAGGPPYIPVGSIEIAQVRLADNAAAAISSAEIFQVVGSHQERYDFPLWIENNAAGRVEFLSAIDKIHTGDLPKAIYASYAAPIFAEVSLASDYVPSETAHSVSSEQVYGSTVGSSSQTLNQGSFVAKLNDGVTDPLVKLKNSQLWFRFYPDKYKAPYILDQGLLGITRTFPAGASMQASCTISAASAAIEKES